MTPEEEAAAEIAKLTSEIRNLTRESEYLRDGFKTLKPEMMTEKLLKGVSAGIYKSMSNAGRAAEEEAVRQSKRRGESELQQDAARARARLKNDEKSARAAYQATAVLTGLGKTAGAVGGFARSMGEAKTGFDTLNPKTPLEFRPDLNK